jgi:phosphoserine aminotransferase
MMKVEQQNLMRCGKKQESLVYPDTRSVGGYRASIYNALPIESIQVLVDVMHTFNQQ